jgi:hypothetical protein
MKSSLFIFDNHPGRDYKESPLCYNLSPEDCHELHWPYSPNERDRGGDGRPGWSEPLAWVRGDGHPKQRRKLGY